MKVTTVSANIRYSRDTGAGAWKVVELGAEATIDGREEWRDAQAHLYRDLGSQLKALWANGQKPDQEAPEKPAETTGTSDQRQTPPPPSEHHCQEHQTPFKRYSRGDSVWYSHKTKDGKWCKEK